MASPIPQISISPPPPQELLIEPYSPFSAVSFLTSSLDDDGFRHRHLTPPPTHTTFNRQLSPLRPSEVAHTGKGLGRERFEALLKASKERNAALGGKKDVDLRKEIALKAHKNKQVDRRALFLSKVHAPPSPTSTMTPKTPPDSPSIFHYSLPSPGLVSPLELFQSLSNDHDSDRPTAREVWVEEVDFRLTVDKPKLRPSAYNVKPKALPSLDQISARLSSHQTLRRPSPGPRPQLQSDIIPPLVASKPASRRLMDVGRLRMPVRERTVSLSKSDTTLIAPHTATIRPTTNAHALESREAKAYNMLSTIKRRTVSMAYELAGGDSEDIDVRRRWKRYSAPADLMPLHERSGFEHPVLSLPGGF